MAEIILTGDALEQLRHLPPESVHTCVTSPPYYNLRDYGAAGQIGNEASVEEYLQSLVSVFREVRRGSAGRRNPVGEHGRQLRHQIRKPAADEHP